jgi:hypothetical protein
MSAGTGKKIDAAVTLKLMVGSGTGKNYVTVPGRSSPGKNKFRLPGSLNFYDVTS